MSETPKERTKRQLCSYLQDYQWTYQVSVFYQSEEGGRNALKDSPMIKKKFRQMFKGVGMLYRLALLRTDNGMLEDKDDSGYTVVPFHCFYFSEPVRGASYDALLSWFGDGYIRVESRAIRQYKIDQTIKTIKKQRLHDLQAYFNDESIKRFSRLNKDYWIPHPDRGLF